MSHAEISTNTLQARSTRLRRFVVATSAFLAILFIVFFIFIAN